MTQKYSPHLRFTVNILFFYKHNFLFISERHCSIISHKSKGKASKRENTSDIKAVKDKISQVYFM